MSTLKVNAIKNTSDVEMYLCKAWVNFNGTGTVAIRASGNVSSITDNGVGDYSVNFTNAMSDANYSCLGSAQESVAVGGINRLITVDNLTASAARILTPYSGTLYDIEGVHVAIFR